jgi:predicted nucleotidyltransferase
MELIKKTIKVGNSAGVLLPKEFLNTEVKIILQPINIEKDVLDILSKEKILEKVLGVYIVGSYARNEETIESDIDILVITDNLDSRIETGKYDLMIVSKKLVDEKMKKNIFPLLPMMLEAKPIINRSLLNDYVNTPLTKNNLEWNITTTKSAMDVVDEYIKLAEKTNEKVSDAASYSLVLRLRTIYIIDCLKNKRLWTKKEFLNLIKKISGSLKAYERYLESKNRNTKEFKLPIDEAKKLMTYNLKKIKDIEIWLKEKKEKERKD